MNDSLFSRQNVKFGVYVGIVAGGLAFLSFIPCLGFILSIVGWMVLLIAGYMTVVIKGGTKDKIADVIKNAVILALIPAAFVAVGSALSGVVGTLVFYPRVTFLDIGPTLADYMITGGIGFVSGAISVVFMFILGAIVSVYYPEAKLPAGSRDMLNKFKTMVMN